MHLETTMATNPKTIQWQSTNGTCPGGACYNQTADYKCDGCGADGEFIWATDASRPLVNDNITLPPAYVRVRSNPENYTYCTVANKTNDPKHFFAETKFYVGASDDPAFVGTYQTADTGCFYFD